MTAPLHIRPAVADDADALKRCIIDAYATYLDRIDDLPPVAEGIEADIADNKVWVAEIGDQVTGGLVLVQKPGHAVLANLAVAPKHGGKGIAKALIDECERFCRSAGLLELRLSTHVEMPTNVDLYAHLGWRKTGITGNKVHMSKSL